MEIPPCRLPDGRWTKKPQHNAMFNAAFSVGESAKGNPACTQNTVEKLSGVRVDHTVVVDFEGFSKMTSAVGGVPVCLPKDIYEGDLNPNRRSRGERIFAKGPQNVSGQQALDYVRIRHGIGDNSDIGRIQRQQAFVGSLIKKVKDQGFNPGTLLPLANAATQSITVDPGLDLGRQAALLRDVAEGHRPAQHQVHHAAVALPGRTGRDRAPGGGHAVGGHQGGPHAGRQERGRGGGAGISAPVAATVQRFGNGYGQQVQVRTSASPSTTAPPRPAWPPAPPIS
ncbi:Polyisoprenyl-teichoic acid--peptidoglycan teichoic acid transferase TagU [Streptomyces rimosus subsp. rimosus]